MYATLRTPCSRGCCHNHSSEGTAATNSSTQSRSMRSRQCLIGDIVHMSVATPQTVHLDEHAHPGRLKRLHAAGESQPEARRRSGLAVAEPMCQDGLPSPSDYCRRPLAPAWRCGSLAHSVDLARIATESGAPQCRRCSTSWDPACKAQCQQGAVAAVPGVCARVRVEVCYCPMHQTTVCKPASLRVRSLTKRSLQGVQPVT